jgi:hypothetical protein
VGAVFNRDEEATTGGDSGASFGSFTEATPMKLLLPDESPASKPPAQPLLFLRQVVVVMCYIGIGVGCFGSSTLKVRFANS